MKLNRLN